MKKNGTPLLLNYVRVSRKTKKNHLEIIQMMFFYYLSLKYFILKIYLHR